MDGIKSWGGNSCDTRPKKLEKDFPVSCWSRRLLREVRIDDDDKLMMMKIPTYTSNFFGLYAGADYPRVQGNVHENMVSYISTICRMLTMAGYATMHVENL